MGGRDAGTGTVTVYLAWSPEPFDPGLSGVVDGPWREVLRAEDHLLLVDSDDTLSRVYHHLKWSFEGSPPLLVSACDGAPKLKGLPAGTTSWVRARTGAAHGRG